MECGLSAYAFASRYGIITIQKPKCPLSNIRRQIIIHIELLQSHFNCYYETNHTKLSTHKRMNWNTLEKKANNGFNVATAKSFINNTKQQKIDWKLSAQRFKLKKNERINSMKYKMNNANSRSRGAFYLKQMSNELYIYFQIQVKCRKFFLKNKDIKLYMISSEKKVFSFKFTYPDSQEIKKNQQICLKTFRKLRDTFKSITF